MMRKWKVVETFTPDDRDLDRGREELTFEFDLDEPLFIAAEAHRLLHGGTLLEAVNEVKDSDNDLTEVNLDEGFDLNYYANDGEYHLRLRPIGGVS